jgi:hypothetical protein
VAGVVEVAGVGVEEGGAEDWVLIGPGVVWVAVQNVRSFRYKESRRRVPWLEESRKAGIGPVDYRRLVLLE